MWGALVKVSVNGEAVRGGIGECVDGHIPTINPWETDHFVSFLVFLYGQCILTHMRTPSCCACRDLETIITKKCIYVHVLGFDLRSWDRV